MTASSWPTIRACISSSSLRSFSFSPAVSWETGMPVRRETMSAMSDEVTETTPSRRSSIPASSPSTSEICRFRSDAFSNSSPATASSFSRRSLARRSSRLTTSVDRFALRSRTRAPAWSIRSMALSGRKRSLM
ncbi:hypothetical protein SBADM41S_05505 [Streptomyces badius]